MVPPDGACTERGTNSTAKVSGCLRSSLHTRPEMTCSCCVLFRSPVLSRATKVLNPVDPLLSDHGGGSNGVLSGRHGLSVRNRRRHDPKLDPIQGLARVV
jgi:hypothetical protein